MSASAGRSSDELCDALRDYVAMHPDAADGLAGIRSWWLPRHLQGVTRERLHEALMDLVERNEMECTSMLDGTELYARVPDGHLTDAPGKLPPRRPVNNHGPAIPPNPKE